MFFVIPLSKAADGIVVVRPRGGQVFTVGNNVISWEAPASLKSVKIDLYKDQQIRKNIDMYTVNDGEYIWYINGTVDHFVAGDDYQIRISGITNAALSGISSWFTINMVVPFIMPEVSIIIVVVVAVVLLALTILFYERKTHKIKRWKDKINAGIRKRKRMKKYKRKVKARNK